MKNFSKDNKKILYNLMRIIKYIWIIDKKYIFVVGISTVIFSIIPAISLILMQNIINFIQEGTNDIELIFNYIILYLSIDLFETVVQGFIGYFNSKFSLNFNLILNKRILETAGDLKLKDYENSEIYDMINRAQYESDGKLLSYFNMFLSIISIFITMLSYLIILFKFKTWLVIVVMIIPVVKYLITNKINLKQFEIIKSRTNEERKAWYYSHIVLSGDSYKELKIYNLFKYFINKYENYITKFNNQDLKITKETLIYLSIFDILDQILNGTIIAYIFYNGYIGVILIGDIITYIKTVLEIKSQIQRVLEVFANIRKESLFIDQLFDFLNLRNNDELEIKSLLEIDEIREIKIKNLFYKYNQNQDYVLKNINLTINKGELIAIVGRNGSGKTTLAKIIMGFYDDYEGEIYVNGVNLKNIDKADYMEKIGVLFQDFTRFEATFRENIGYGNLEIMDDDDKIMEIMNKFKIADLVADQKDYLDTQLGYWFDSGKQISIGQWQKLALSRAFAKKADIYFLDEPNAALDAISEYNMSKLYSELLRNKIGVIIAHRFNNFIKQANNIIVMESGTIIERGTHSQLTNSGELYKKLYDLQTRNDEKVQSYYFS